MLVEVKQKEKFERIGMGYKNDIDWGNEIGEDFEKQHKKYKEIIKEIIKQSIEGGKNERKETQY